MTNRIKLLYIAGSGRSGSTLIDNILSQVDGVFSTGELYHVWDRNLLGGQPCGCRNQIHECKVWGRVLNEGFGGAKAVNAKRMIEYRERYGRTRHLPWLLFPALRRALSRNANEYLNALRQLYLGASVHSGAHIIVDSSKVPAHAFHLLEIDDLEVYVLHLVRDPRGVAFSRKRKKPMRVGADERTMPSMSAAKSTRLWMGWNAGAELLWWGVNRRYMRLRYEDFIAQPRTNLDRILSLVGHTNAHVGHLSEDRYIAGPNHTLSGNPVRFRTGEIRLELDDAWKDQLNPRDRFVTEVLAWPLMLRYRYAISVGSLTG